MSTRSNIVVESQGGDIILYRHSDGYPSGVLPDIVPFLQTWRKTRGADPEYMSARLLQYLTNLHDRGTAGEFGGTLGYGIARGVADDAEFLYSIDPEVETLTVYSLSGRPRKQGYIAEIKLGGEIYDVDQLTTLGEKIQKQYQ